MGEKILKVGHWYNSGDLISALPGFKFFYEKHGIKFRIYQKIGLPVFYYNNAEHPILNKDGVNSSMDMATFGMLKPLIEYQSYVESFQVWEGEDVDFDFLNTRDSRLVPIPNSDLCFWVFFIFPQLCCDLSVPWLELPPSNNIFNDLVISEHIIVNRTRRYTNPYISYHFLKDYQDRVIFAGIEDEHKRFCEDFKLEIPRLNIVNFTELAQAINSCKFFIGNQSFAFWIADAIKKKRILEVCGSFPNTLPHGKDGYAFLHQKALEIHFEQLING